MCLKRRGLYCCCDSPTGVVGSVELWRIGLSSVNCRYASHHQHKQHHRPKGTSSRSLNLLPAASIFREENRAALFLFTFLYIPSLPRRFTYPTPFALSRWSSIGTMK